MTTGDNIDTSMSGKRVLVTGAAGFIGSALCRALLTQGAEVHGVSRVDREGDGVRWWRVDLSDAEATAAVMWQVRPNLVFHLASHVSGSRAIDAVYLTFRDILVATLNLFSALCDVGRPRVILAGSMEENDSREPAVPPVSPYAAAKSATRSYAQLFHALYGLPVVHLRIFMVYGPGQRDTTKLIPYVTTSFLRGEQPQLSSGTREIDWVYIDDVVAGLIAAAGAEAVSGQTIDIGSGELFTVRSVVERIAGLVGGGVVPRFGVHDDRPIEHRRVADVARTGDLLGWKPTTSLLAGLEQTVRSLRLPTERRIGQAGN